MPKSSQKKGSPLQQKYDSLPKSIDFKTDFLPKLEEVGITEWTFYRDLKADPKNIPAKRLLAYAGFFDCELSELIDSYVKVKPLVRNSILKKSGLKTA